MIGPFYKERSLQTQKWIAEYFDDALDYHVHVCEGAFFLWIWFRDLPISDRELYERLKAKKVLVVPGCYFFEGLEEPWAHQHECIRITYCAKPESVKRGHRDHRGGSPASRTGKSKKHTSAERSVLLVKNE